MRNWTEPFVMYGELSNTSYFFILISMHEVVFLLISNLILDLVSDFGIASRLNYTIDSNLVTKFMADISIKLTT